jgi:hypothetical protein
VTLPRRCRREAPAALCSCRHSLAVCLWDAFWVKPPVSCDNWMALQVAPAGALEHYSMSSNYSFMTSRLISDWLQDSDMSLPPLEALQR